MRHLKRIGGLGLFILAIAACAPRGPSTLTVMTHDSFEISEELVLSFEEAHDAKVQFLKAGDTGTALNKAILSKSAPLADVFYGVDNTFLSRALEQEIFEPYDSPLLEELPLDLQLDPSNRAIPVDYGDVCLNYDRAFFTNHGIDPPTSLEALIQPEYKGLLVVENPATSSPGLAFLLATIGHFGEQGFENFWGQLVQNEVRVVNDWETAYYTEFSLSGGTRPIVVSYGSSPPAEVYFAEEALEISPSVAVTENESCFRQIEFVGILEGTKQRALAEAWVDFMLSIEFQESLPLSMFVFPANPKASLPEVFQIHAILPASTAQVDPDRIAEMREAWITIWRETVLQ